jgi:hypothetical protein
VDQGPHARRSSPCCRPICSPSSDRRATGRWSRLQQQARETRVSPPELGPRSTHSLSHDVAPPVSPICLEQAAWPNALTLTGGVRREPPLTGA